jgi:uncharacterized protein
MESKRGALRRQQPNGVSGISWANGLLESLAHFLFKAWDCELLRLSNKRISPMPREATLRIGVISDTHDLLRPEALEALRGSEQIIHAGDVGDPAILDQLAAIAPVTVVRGNIDTDPWALRLPENAVVEAAGISIYVLHDLSQLDLKPEAAGFHVVIYGHSHVPKQEVRNGVMYFNPGSAGPRRFKLPITVGRLTIEKEETGGNKVNSGKVRAEIVTISD